MFEKVIFLLSLVLVTVTMTATLLCAWEDLHTGREWRGSILWFGFYVVLFVYDFIHLMYL